MVPQDQNGDVMTKGCDINGRSKVIWLKNKFTTTGGDGHHLIQGLFVWLPKHEPDVQTP